MVFVGTLPEAPLDGPLAAYTPSVNLLRPTTPLAELSRYFVEQLGPGVAQVHYVATTDY